MRLLDEYSLKFREIVPAAMDVEQIIRVPLLNSPSGADAVVIQVSSFIGSVPVLDIRCFDTL